MVFGRRLASLTEIKRPVLASLPIFVVVNFVFAIRNLPHLMSGNLPRSLINIEHNIQYLSAILQFPINKAAQTGHDLPEDGLVSPLQ